MHIKKAKAEHEVCYQDLVKLVEKHAKNLTPLEILAIAANMVGKLVAMQDQSATTPSEAMEIVARNLELGNRNVIDILLGTKGNG